MAENELPQTIPELSGWLANGIRHYHSETEHRLRQLEFDMSTMQCDLDEIKNLLSIIIGSLPAQSESPPAGSQD